MPEILTDFMDAFPEVDSISVRIYPEASRSKINRTGTVDIDSMAAEAIFEKYGSMVPVEVMRDGLLMKSYIYAKIIKNGTDFITIVRGPHSVTNLLEQLDEVMK